MAVTSRDESSELGLAAGKSTVGAGGTLVNGTTAARAEGVVVGNYGNTLRTDLATRLVLNAVALAIVEVGQAWLANIDEVVRG
jgi:hypothetical protein